MYLFPFKSIICIRNKNYNFSGYVAILVLTLKLQFLIAIIFITLNPYLSS